MGFVHSDWPAFIDAFMLLFVDDYMKALSLCFHLYLPYGLDVLS